MSKRQTKTDHSHLEQKIQLRINHLPKRKKITVLNAFHGDGTIWRNITGKVDKEIAVIGIDKKGGGSGLQLTGDNVKFLKSMNLAAYDVIDLDAYGVPYQSLKEVLRNRTIKKGTAIFLTFIQIIHGGLPYAMLEELGYTRKMIKKIPTLFYRDGFQKFKQYLAFHGVKNVAYIQKKTKFYVYCRTS